MTRKERIQNIADASENLLKNGPISFKGIFDYFVNKSPSTVALTHHDLIDNNIREYTYEQYKHYVETFANKLSVILKEFPKDSIVALKLRNTPFWCFTFWGLLMAGYRPLLIDAKLEEENTLNLLKESNAVGIITDDKFGYGIKIINRNIINDINENAEFTPNWSDEVIFCSSGTTGNIKLVIFNGVNMVNQLNASKVMSEENLDIYYPQDVEPLRTICLIPFHHIFGFVSIFLWYSFYNSTLVFTDYTDPISLLKDIRDLKITHIYHVPLFYDVVTKNFLGSLDEKTTNKVKTLIDHTLGRDKGSLFDGLLEKKIKDSLFGNQIKYLISGGGHLSSETSEFINGIGYPLNNGYGMTEIGVTSVELSTDPKIRIKNSIGHALYNIEYKLGKNNELLIKSPITHVKEIVNGKEIPTKLDKENFFASGDIAFIDTDNRVYLKGRLKDVIISSNGENVYPDEVESYFKKVKGIKNLCAFGSLDKIILIVETEENIIETLNEINKNLPIHKQVNKIILTKQPLPLSSSMKVKRFLVKEEFEKGKYEDKKIKKISNILKDYPKEKVEKIVDKLINVYKKILFTNKDIDCDGHWINDLHSDSMTYITLISEIEKEFNIKIAIEKYGKLTTLNEFAKEILDSN